MAMLRPPRARAGGAATSAGVVRHVRAGRALSAAGLAVRGVGGWGQAGLVRTVTAMRANAASSSAKLAIVIGTLLADRPAMLAIVAAGKAMAVQAGMACARQSPADISSVPHSVARPPIMKISAAPGAEL